MTATLAPSVWFPTVRCGSGTDVFTERLCAALNKHGIRAEITWLPHRAEYAPWTVPVPEPPPWANVVHVNSWLHPRFLPHHLPVITTLHFCVYDSALAPYKSLAQKLYHALWIRGVEEANLCRAHRVTAVSHYTAQVAKAALGLASIQVIHNGIDTQQFIPAHRETPNKPFRLLYVGNWSERKGVDLLGPILSVLGSDFELHYTADRDGLHRRYSLPSNCQCLGRLTGETLVRAYQEADALLFPSRLEGLPLATVEGMACELPVIASDATSLPEVVAHEVTGFLCPVDDRAAFIHAIRTLEQNPEVWKRMRIAARQRAEALFSLARMTEAYISMYKKVLT